MENCLFLMKFYYKMTDIFRFEIIYGTIYVISVHQHIKSGFKELNLSSTRI